jgi:hypothetical protein
MGFGICLTLDAKLNHQVQESWRLFERARIGTTPGQCSEPPHVTFSDTPSGSAEALWNAAKDLHFAETELQLVPVGIFPGAKHVFYYNAVLCRGLHNAYMAHYELIRLAEIPVNPLYAPGSVLFHCTIAVDVDEADLGTALGLVYPAAEAVSGHASAIELWEYFPAKRIYRRELSKPDQ